MCCNWKLHFVISKLHAVILKLHVVSYKLFSKRKNACHFKSTLAYFLAWMTKKSFISFVPGGWQILCDFFNHFRPIWNKRKPNWHEPHLSSTLSTFFLHSRLVYTGNIFWQYCWAMQFRGANIAERSNIPG